MEFDQPLGPFGLWEAAAACKIDCYPVLQSEHFIHPKIN